MTEKTDVAIAEEAPEEAPGAIAESTDEATYHRWSQSRIRIQERIDAIGGELRQTSDALDETRKAAILAEGDSEGDSATTVATEAVGQLVGRQRVLEAERDELLERFGVASAEEARLQRMVAEAQLIEVWTSFSARASELGEAAVATDAEIGEIASSLRDALVRRWEIDQAALSLASELEESREQHTRAGFDVPAGRLILPHSFDAHTIPALVRADARLRYNLSI
jgi:hypothetical protein